MSLCRYLPTPSERMGIIWSLLEIKEAVVLEFGPAGTTHYSLSEIGSLGINVNENLYATHLDEKDVIMGDTKRIEDALMEIDKEYKPKVIFLVGSSVSSVIATDLKGVCNSMEDTINAKMLCFEGGGFRGDYSDGLKEALTSIAKEIVKAEEDEKKRVFNIIGATLEEYRVRSNVEEIENIMRECFDFELGTSYTLNSSISEIESSGNSSINLVIRSEGIDAGEIIKEKTNTPFLYGTPYGYLGTLNWIENVSKLINISPSEKYIKKIKEKMMEAKQFQMYKHFLSTPLKVSIAGNYDMAIGFSKFFKDEIGFEVENLICNHKLKSIKNRSENIKYIGSEKDKINIIKSIENSIVLGDDITLALSDESNISVKVSNPSIEGQEFLSHMPFIGYKGADFMLEKINRYIINLMKKS